MLCCLLAVKHIFLVFRVTLYDVCVNHQTYLSVFGSQEFALIWIAIKKKKKLNSSQTA